MDDIDNNLYPEPTREETRQLEQENALRQLTAKQMQAALQKWAGTLRDPVKKTFALAYAAFKFGGSDKFWWNGKIVAWDAVWTSVPDTIRKVVYRKGSDIEAGVGERVNGAGRASLRKLPDGTLFLAIRTNGGWIKMTPLDAEAEGDFGAAIELTQREMDWFSDTLRELLGEP